MVPRFLHLINPSFRNRGRQTNLMPMGKTNFYRDQCGEHVRFMCGELPYRVDHRLTMNYLQSKTTFKNKNNHER
jgi:hypothetical protein